MSYSYFIFFLICNWCNLDSITSAGAKKAREVVFSVLRDACVDGDLSIPEAVAAVKDLFAENAKQYYKLDISSKYSDVKPPLSSAFQEEELNGSLKDVTFVRIIWIDASGQHRCRVSFALSIDVTSFHLRL